MRTLLPASIRAALAGSAWAAPALTSGGVLNATGYQPLLAPDSVFAIYGSGMGPAALVSAPGPSYPSSLSGTSVIFTPATGAGAPISAGIIYTLATQVGGFFPSSVAPGSYNVTVTYSGQTSAAQSVTVVARSFGIATSNSAGTGAAQATIGNVNNDISLVRMTAGTVNFGGHAWTLSPAHPGDQLVLWGTGGGADPANDTGGTSGDQTAAGNFTVTVDGTPIVPLYSGASSGYPGLWQINFLLPSSISADCFASLQVSAGGQLSNSVTIAIAAPGQTSCSSVIPPVTLSKLDSGTGTVTMAGLNIGQLISGSGPRGSVGGVVNQYTVAEFLLPFSGPKVGGCSILQETCPAGAKEPSAADSQLDAGALTIGGTGLPVETVTKIAGAAGPVYNSSLAITDGNPYTLTGAGGSQVGPFTISTTFPSSFSVTNLSALSTVNRNQPLVVNWTGSGFNQVLIDITTAVLTSKTTRSVTVTCPVPAGPGTFTVPTAALACLIPSATTSQLQVTADNSQGGYIDYLVTPTVH